MQTTKLSDFLKQQGSTPQGKSVYQAFIDRFDKDFSRHWEHQSKCAISSAFVWNATEDPAFWGRITIKWGKVENPENDMLWLLDGKEPPKEAGGEDELEERRRKEAVTPTEQPPILPIGTNKLLDTEETKELDETVKAADPFGYFESVGASVENLRDDMNQIKTNIKMRVTPEQVGVIQKICSGKVQCTSMGNVRNHIPYTVYIGKYNNYQELLDMEEVGVDLFIRTNGTCEQTMTELAPEDKIDNIDGKSHLNTILAERAAKYGSYKAQAKCVGDIILATQEVAKANGKQQTAEQIGSIAYLAIKIARYANGETGDTLDDLEGYAKRIREMERDNV